MSKLEATNVFSEGLISDLNAITTPNNVLTNALNATLITMNGNEFVLQNDLGNGRVETAKLPTGFVPLGVKEYGGIIYVASYNPITKKGQLGSFPSPERNLTQDEIGNNIERVQEYSKSFDINAEFIPGVWDNYLRYLIYLNYCKDKKSKHLDINGYVDKDVEKFLLRSGV